MKRPLQPAARARWSDRLRAIGAALEDMTKLGGIEPDSGERKVHVGTLARLTKIPETSLRSILGECFTEVVVPGFVVGYGGNWIYLAPAERRPVKGKVPLDQRVPACGGDPSCKTHGGGEFGADPARECRR